MTAIALNKGIVALMAIMFMFCLTPLTSHKINAEITSYRDNVFRGQLNIDGNKLPMIIEVEEKTINENKKEDIREDRNINENKDINENRNINENRKDEKFNENTKITDDKTPGKIKITIENGPKKAVLERDIGSGTMSDIDREIYKQVSDSLTEFVSKNKGISGRVRSAVNSFAEHCNRPASQRKWCRWF